jgi:DNA-directed RNA polymerase subunit RPC12/RpoP
MFIMAILQLIFGATFMIMGTCLINPDQYGFMSSILPESAVLSPELTHAAGYLMTIIGVMMVIIAIFNIAKAMLNPYGYSSFSFSSSSSSSSHDYDDDDDDNDDDDDYEEVEKEKIETVEEDDDDLQEQIDEINEKIRKLDTHREYICSACGRQFIADNDFTGFIPECPSCGNVLYVSEVKKNAS